jgi:hypothetical protein
MPRARTPSIKMMEATQDAIDVAATAADPSGKRKRKRKKKSAKNEVEDDDDD